MIVKTFNTVEKIARRAAVTSINAGRQKAIIDTTSGLRPILREMHGQAMEVYKSRGVAKKLQQKQYELFNDIPKSVLSARIYGLIDKANPTGQREFEMWVGDAFGEMPFGGNVLGQFLFRVGVTNFNKGAQKLVNAAGRFTFNLRDKTVIESVRRRANNVSGIMTEARWNSLKGQIARSYFVEGKNPIRTTLGPRGGTRSSVAQDIADWFDGDLGRAELTARTEVSVIESWAQKEWRERSGIEYHSWMIADMNARDAHIENDGVVVKIGDEFPDGQRWVGDGDDIRLIANCRCANLSELGPSPNEEDIWLGDMEA